MELRGVEVRESPRLVGWVRLSGDIRYQDGGSEEIWLDVPESFASALSVTGDPFLAWLAPAAASTGEPLRLNFETDRDLLENIRHVMRVWRSWYPALRDVEVDGPHYRKAEAPAARIASFFTGGVDSFFTVLRHHAGQGTPSSVHIDDLVFVHGFDVPIGNAVAFGHVRDLLCRVADRLQKPLLTAATNLRETRFGAADWSRLSHGAALAGVGHALGKRYGTFLIASSGGYRDLRPWGSHPLTDPMFTSSTVRIVHDGADFMRVEKTEYVAQIPLALQHLRVCYRSSDGGNCGECNGCYRTMLALEALGVLVRCDTFDRGVLDLRRASRVYCAHDYDVRQFRYVRELAVRASRQDIATAVDHSLRRSRRLARQLGYLDRVRHLPVAWRLVPALERRLMSGWIA